MWNDKLTLHSKILQMCTFWRLPTLVVYQSYLKGVKLLINTLTISSNLFYANLLVIKDKKVWTFRVQLLHLESHTTSSSCLLHLLFAHWTNVQIFKYSRNGNHRWQQFFFIVATWRICKARERGRGEGKSLIAHLM